MDMIGKVRRMHCREQEVGARDRAAARACRATRCASGCKAPVLEAPKYRRERGAGQAHAVPRGAQAGAEGRRAPAQARAAHGAGAVRRRSRPRATPAATARVTDFIRAWRQGEGQSVSTQGLRAAGLRARRGVPVRLERRRPGGRRHLLPHAGVAHEAVRQPRVLAGGLPEPGPRDAVRRPHPLASRRWAASPGAASTTT